MFLTLAAGEGKKRKGAKRKGAGLSAYLKADPAGRWICRSRTGILLAVKEEALDYHRMAGDGMATDELGVKVRVMSADLHEELACYLIPRKLCFLSKKEAAALEGEETPLGRLTCRGGLWLHHRPGLKEVGVDHLGTRIMRWEAGNPDPSAGPLPLSFRPGTARPAKVAAGAGSRHRALVEEARAWAEISAMRNPVGSFREKVRLAGLTLQISGNWPNFRETLLPLFFRHRHPVMSEAAAALSGSGQLRIEGWEIILLDPSRLPAGEKEHNSWKNWAAVKAPPALSGRLPRRLSSSFLAGDDGTFFAESVHLPPDPSTPPAERTAVAAGAAGGDRLITDVIRPLLSQALLPFGARVLNGLALSFSRGAGTSFICCGQGIEEELTSLFLGIGEPGPPGRDDEGSLLQRGAAVLKEEGGKLMILPLSRSILLPSRPTGWWQTRLAGHSPVLIDPAADFGAARDPSRLATITHDFPGEQLLYDDAWRRLPYRPEVAEVGSMVFLWSTRGKRVRLGRLDMKLLPAEMAGLKIPDGPALYFLEKGGADARLLLEACRLAATRPGAVPPGRALGRREIVQMTAGRSRRPAPAP